MSAPGPVRRVVTGHDAAGRAVFVRDEQVEPLLPSVAPGSAFHQLWNGDGPPHFPDDGARPEPTTYFPRVGGFRFNLFTIPSGPVSLPEGYDVAAGLQEMETMLPGMFRWNERDDPGMHTTPTIDFEVVLSGTCTLELDDGAVVRLHPGDTVVQNGTRHRWGNPGPEPCTLAVFLVGAEHDNVGWD